MINPNLPPAATPERDESAPALLPQPDDESEHLPEPILDVEKSDKAREASKKRFCDALLRVSGTANTDDARVADWRFDGAYDVRDRDGETTNYVVLFDEDKEKTRMDDSVERRCTICHQPISNVSLISVNGQVVQMGSDCTAKLQRFLETGEIIPENPAKEILKEQSAILLEGAEYERNAMQRQLDELKKTDYEAWERSHIITNRKIIASMMSWLEDHIDDEEIPENIRYAIASYNNTGIFPSTALVRETSEYYKAVRKFLPEEILADWSGYVQHPHKTLLRNITSDGVVQNDIPQLERIIEKGRELTRQRYTRERLGWNRVQDEDRAWDMATSEDRQRRDAAEEKLQRQEEKKLQEKQRREQRKIAKQEMVEARQTLDKLVSSGYINKDRFYKSHPLPVDDILCSIDEQTGKVNLESVPSVYDNSSSFFEIDNDGTIDIYELNQVEAFGSDPLKYYLVLDGNNEQEVRGYLPSIIAKYKHLIRPFWSESRVRQALDPYLPTYRLRRYSCAQVAISKDTGEPMVLLKEGAVPLDLVLSEYNIIER